MNHRLENEKVSSLLFSLALPSILAQLATLIYNMVDNDKSPNRCITTVGALSNSMYLDLVCN